MKTKTLQHRFVDNIPDEIEEGALYISLQYCTAIHKCVCGCGNEVVTPISPTDWELTFDGETVSLYPSIGNWSYACKSHYFITKSKIRPAFKWTEKQVKRGRKNEAEQKEKYYTKKKSKRK
jgi:hypothetical protein